MDRIEPEPSPPAAIPRPSSTWPMGQVPRLVSAADVKHGAFPDAATMLEAFYAHAPIGIMLANGQGQVVGFNPACLAMLGYTAEELVALGPVGMTHPDDVAAEFVLFGELMRGEREHYRLEKRYIRKDGASLTAMLTMFRTGELEQPYLIAMVEDLTEKRPPRR